MSKAATIHVLLHICGDPHFGVRRTVEGLAHPESALARAMQRTGEHYGINLVLSGMTKPKRKK